MKYYAIFLIFMIPALTLAADDAQKPKSRCPFAMMMAGLKGLKDKFPRHEKFTIDQPEAEQEAARLERRDFNRALYEMFSRAFEPMTKTYTEAVERLDAEEVNKISGQITALQGEPIELGYDAFRFLSKLGPMYPDTLPFFRAWFYHFSGYSKEHVSKHIYGNHRQVIRTLPFDDITGATSPVDSWRKKTEKMSAEDQKLLAETFLQNWLYNGTHTQTSFKFDEDLRGQSERFLIGRIRGMDSLNSRELEAHLLMAVTPVGPYGDRFARRLQRTTQILIQIAYQSLKEPARELFEKQKDLLVEESARGNPHAPLSPLSTFIEGIISVHQGIVLLTSGGVPGAETGDQALKRLVEDGTYKYGVVSKLSSMLTLGFLGPATLRGQYPTPGVIEKTGRLYLSPEFEKKLQFYKTKKQKGILSHTYRNERNGLGMGCPLGACFADEANPQLTSQIHRLTELYYKVFKSLEVTETKP
jgi:hypothetical protein